MKEQSINSHFLKLSKLFALLINKYPAVPTFVAWIVILTKPSSEVTKTFSFLLLYGKVTLLNFHSGLKFTSEDSISLNKNLLVNL